MISGRASKVVVIGAGATGLAVAYILARNGCDVEVIEAAPVAGGLLSTFDVGNGARLEHFYHHFFTHDAEINWLFSELGLSDKVVFKPTTMGILRGGTVYPFNGPMDLLHFKAISMIARLRFGLSSAMLIQFKAYSEANDQPALEWFRKWAGRAATDAVWGPMLACKFGDSAERIPLAWMAGRLRQRTRSRKGTVERLGYLDGSLQVLVDRLLEFFKSSSIPVRLSERVEQLEMTGDAVSGVRTASGTIKADAVISTLPTDVLAKLVQPINTDYAQRLSSIQYVGAICVVLVTKEPISPVYWLNIADPGSDFGGVIAQTNFVDPAVYGGVHITYLSRYMKLDNELWSLDDSTLVARQTEQLGRILGRDISNQIDRSWVFRARQAAPVTETGFFRNIPTFKSPIPGLYMGSMCHVYPDERSVNNSIRVAAELVKSMGFNSDFVPRGISLAAKYGQ